MGGTEIENAPEVVASTSCITVCEPQYMYKSGVGRGLGDPPAMCVPNLVKFARG